MAIPRRYPLIFNPRARSKKGGKAKQFLMEHANRFALYATNTGDEARELAAKFAADGEPIVIAAGGDGTLNAVVAGLAGSRTALGIMPAGTMNVFARELGIPPNNLPAAFQVIENGFIREIDLFSANNSPFVQMAGIGFDAKVIEETTWESKKRLGPLAYLLSAVKVLGEKPLEITVTTAEGRVEKGIAVICGNGSLYGGQFTLFRNADNHDSMLDVIIFKEAGYRLVVDSLHGLAQGGIDLAGSTSYFQASGLTATCPREVPVEIDGEWLGRFTTIQFTESSTSLRVIAPEHPLGTPFVDAVKSVLHWPSKPAELATTKSP